MLTAIFLCFCISYVCGMSLLDRPTHLFLDASRRRVSPEMIFLYKQRVRRAEVDCSNLAQNNVEIQQAISSMIIGNDDKSYLTKFTQHKHRPKNEVETSGLCNENSGNEDVSPDTPLQYKALCGFHYIENVNTKRLPQMIPEVACSCTKPTNELVNNKFPHIHCEPIYYNVPVIKFKDESCTNFEKTTERISLACVPVLSSQSSSKINIETSEGHRPSLPS